MLLYILLIAILLLLLIVLTLQVKSKGENNNSLMADLRYKLDSFTSEIARIEMAVKNEVSINRVEANTVNRDTREELAKTIRVVGEQLSSLTNAVETKLKEFSEANNNSAKDSRKELKESLESFTTGFSRSVNEFNTAQKDNFFALLNKQSEQNTATSNRLDQLRETLEKKMTELQSGNEKKLEEMRTTVDEKLQKTLETRLGESFRLVSERLEAVHKGLGDMQQLATGVGDLKRVLSNVKTRGVLGEYQLESILDHILTPEQYAKNVKTKEGSNALVEFAVKLPHKEDRDRNLWLPIDSKFPKEDFELLMDAYEKADAEGIEEHRKNFVKGIKKCAFDISSKYIDPPNTTDFAILFLPFESLYAEVLRTPGLFESLQREFKIIITGPTTLSAILNSFQMGFRTLAIEKRSSEVWQLLGAVKTEFGNFGDILDKTQKKILEASNVIEKAGVRSRAIERRLRNVQELPKDQTAGLLGDVIDNTLPASDETDDER